MWTRHFKQSKNTAETSYRVKTAKWLHLMHSLGEAMKFTVIDKADLNWQIIYCFIQ